MCEIHDVLGSVGCFFFFLLRVTHVFDFDIRVLGLLQSARLMALCQVELTLFQAVAGCRGLCFEEV